MLSAHRFNQVFTVRSRKGWAESWESSGHCTCGHRYNAVSSTPSGAMDGVQEQAVLHEESKEVDESNQGSLNV